MTEQLRQLTAEDITYYKEMQTGLDDDYMLQVFDRITAGANYLFGIFVEDELVALSGFTLFKHHYAMLGRLRVDRRYRKNGYGTRIVEYSLKQAALHPDVEWIGANTERHNKAAQAVLKKVGLPPVAMLYAAQTASLETLVSTESTVWEACTDTNRNWDWIRQTYLDPAFDKKVFPLEAYYPFPVNEKMFEGSVEKWRFFENADSTRYVLLWEEFKGKNYMHVVYPWHDFIDQPGLFETIQQELLKAQQIDSETTIWWDMSEQDTAMLPSGHPFNLPSPWMLHGLSKEALLTEDVSESFEKANRLIQDVEEELKALEDIIDTKADKVDSLFDRLDDK